jgi:2-polyprenyl-3-methyl-5-hydroxy-6-metoxy-1,4-benzoquinol methylase
LEDKTNVPRETIYMKTYTNCPICEAKNFTPFLTCDDNTGSDERFNIVKCTNCNFAFTNPIPLESEIGKYYESDDYISHSNTSKGLVNFLYQKVRNYTLDKKVSLLQRISNNRNLLDIGCGTGEFLARAKQHGFSVKGIEPSESAKLQAIKNFQLTVEGEKHLAELASESFDFITMWHVLEHVFHLNERIVDLKRLIKKDGSIIIAVPNLQSYDAKKYKKHWAAYDVPRHLYHFSEKDIKKLALKHDLQVTQTLPMKFDSFYVSMLSERYKTGNQNLLAAFFTGLKSNIVANSSGGYSSQIYVLKSAN